MKVAVGRTGMTRTIAVWLLAATACSPAYSYTPSPLPLFAEAPSVPRPGPANRPAEHVVALSSAPFASVGIAAGPRSMLQLSDVIRACVLGDPRIVAALESVHMAQGDSTTSELLPNPGLMIGQTLNPIPGRPFTVSQPGGPPQLDIGISYALDGILFGKRSAAMEAAHRAVDVAAAAYADAVRQRVLEAITIFYDVLEAKALFELSKEAYTQFKTLETITSQRVTLGSIGTIELDRVRLAVLAAHREMLRSDAEVDKAVARLRVRLGPTFADKPVDVDGSLELERPAEAPSFADALALAEASRPDVLAAKRATRQTSAEAKTERRNAYPELSVSVGYTRQFQSSLGVPDANAWGVGLGTTLPVFHRNEGAIAKADAANRKSVAELESVELELRSDVEQALREYRVARDIVTQDVVGTLGAAGAAREKILESYRLGGKTLIEVLDAHNAYRDAVRLTIEARAGFWKAKHALNAAIGREVLP